MKKLDDFKHMMLDYSGSIYGGASGASNDTSSSSECYTADDDCKRVECTDTCDGDDLDCEEVECEVV